MAQEEWKHDQDELGLQKPEGPILCKNNCGFFGSSTTLNMCSKCYRETVLKQSKSNSSRIEVETQVSVIELESKLNFEPQPTSVNLKSDNSSSSQAKSSEGAPPQPNRCFTCNKRVGLTGFTCRCSHVFCPIHRYSDKHDCSFDYKTLGRASIQKANPVVKGQKVDKI